VNGTFAPAPGSAPTLRKVTAQGSMELRLILRNGEQLLLALVIPILVLIGGVQAAGHLGLLSSDHVIDLLPPGVFALAIMSSSFTSLAIATGFERRYGVIKRLGASPLSRTELLAGKVLGLLGLQILQIVVLAAVAWLLGWRPSLVGIIPAMLVAILGTAAFASLGLLVAGTLRAEATLAAANLIYILLLAGGGTVLPSTSYGIGGKLLALLPSGALGDGLRSTLADGHWPWWTMIVLAVWTAIGALLTARTFKWE